MFNLYVTGKGVSDANRKELCFYMSREEEILGVDEVTVEEDVVMVVEGSKKQTLWLTGITASWYKDSGAQGLARQGSYIGT